MGVIGRAAACCNSRSYCTDTAFHAVLRSHDTARPVITTSYFHHTSIGQFARYPILRKGWSRCAIAVGNMKRLGARSRRFARAAQDVAQRPCCSRGRYWWRFFYSDRCVYFFGQKTASTGTAGYVLITLRMVWLIPVRNS